MVNISIDEVRTTSGATIDLISDELIQKIIDIVKPKAFNHFDFKEIPTDTMEFYRGYDLNDIKVNKTRIMSLKEIYINTTQRDISDYTFDSNFSKIQNRREYQRNRFSLFPKNEPYQIKIKYTYAMLKPSQDSIVTESTADTQAGTSVVIAVDDKTGFSEDDYVRFLGFDGNNEVAKITAVGTSSITLDTLFLAHTTGSVIELLETPRVIKDYILYDCAYNVANYIIGNTSDLPTSFTQEGVSATIGVAYTHWRESSANFKTQRDEIEGDVLALKTTIL